MVVALESEVLPRKVHSSLAKSNAWCNSLSQAQPSPSLNGNAPFFIGT